MSALSYSSPTVWYKPWQVECYANDKALLNALEAHYYELIKIVTKHKHSVCYPRPSYYLKGKYRLVTFYLDFMDNNGIVVGNTNDRNQVCIIHTKDKSVDELAQEIADFIKTF